MRRALGLVFVSFVLASCNCGENLKSTGPDIEVTPLSIDFGTLAAGAAASRAVTVSNTGSQLLTVSRVGIEGDARLAFKLSGPIPKLNSGAMVTLSISYTAPAVAGTDTASVFIDSDATSNTQVRLSLTGRAVIDGGDDGGVSDAGDGGGSSDGGEDGGFDGGRRDAGTEDAGEDAGLDAGEDAGADAGFDGGARPDGGEVVLTFDDAPNDGFLPSGYGGLTWDNDWYVYFTVDPNYEAHSGTQYITNDVQPSPISFSFPSPVYFEGAWFSLDPTRNAHVSFDVYDSTGGYLGSSAMQAEQLVPQFLPVNIANVSKVSVNFDVDFAMDDVTYIP